MKNHILPCTLSLQQFKTLQESQKAAREHIIGCQGVKLCLLKDVTVTTFTTATVNTVTITTGWSAILATQT